MEKPEHRPNVYRLLPHEHQLGDYADDLRALIEAVRDTDDPRVAKAAQGAEDVERLLLAIAREIKL